MGVIIGISGKIGSGKDTVAQYIIDNMQLFKFQQKSFAYNLKHISAIISGKSVDSMFTQEGKNVKLPMYNDISVGELQQIIGTDLFREEFDEDVWIKSLFASYDKANDNWVVSDVRFENEAETIRKMGGILVRLEGDPTGIRANSNRNMNHASETDLDDYEHFDIVFRTEPGTEKLAKLTTALGRIMFDKLSGNDDLEMQTRYII